MYGGGAPRIASVSNGCRRFASCSKAIMPPMKPAAARAAGVSAVWRARRTSDGAAAGRRRGLGGEDGGGGVGGARLEQQLPHTTLARPFEQRQYEQRARLEAIALPGGEAPAAGAGARCAGLEPRHLESDDVVRAECSDELLVEPRARLWRGRK